MAITPQSPFPKSRGDTVRSTDWNQAVNEVIRLDNAKVNRGGDTVTGALTVNGGIVIPDGSLSGAKLANDSTPGAKLQDGTLPSSKLADNSLPGSKLSDNSTPGGKLADASVAATKLNMLTWSGTTTVAGGQETTWSFNQRPTGAAPPRVHPVAQVTNMVFPQGSTPPTVVINEFVYQSFFVPASNQISDFVRWTNPTTLTVTLHWTIYYWQV
jgi:hypothetical protein